MESKSGVPQSAVAPVERGCYGDMTGYWGEQALLAHRQHAARNPEVAALQHPRCMCTAFYFCKHCSQLSQLSQLSHLSHAAP